MVNINFASDDDQVSRRHQNMPIRVFYAYLIYEKEYGEDTITKDDCLYQYFLVDIFSNVKENMLDYIRMNQNNL